MHNETTAKTIIERAAKAMQRRNRDGKPFRPVQDPLIQLAADLQDKSDRQAEEIERLNALVHSMSDRPDALAGEINDQSALSNAASETVEA